MFQSNTINCFLIVSLVLDKIDYFIVCIQKSKLHKIFSKNIYCFNAFSFVFNTMLDVSNSIEYENIVLPLLNAQCIY